MLEKLKQFINKILSFNIGNIFHFEMNNKIADKQEYKLGEVNNIDNSNQILQQNFYIGIQYKDLIDIVQREQSLANNKLMSKIEPRLLPENIDKIKNDFDFLDTYREAVKISAKRKDEFTDNMLADIISERIKKTDDFNKIIVNEAITTIGKLTKTQIEILHLLSICHHTHIVANTYEQLVQNIDEILKPLFNVDCKFDDFDYLSYVGCIDIAFTGFFNFFDIINNIVNREYDMEVFKNSEVYKHMEDKWMNSQLKQTKPTAIGKYIGLKYHKIKFNIEINDIDKIFKDIT